MKLNKTYTNAKGDISIKVWKCSAPFLNLLCIQLFMPNIARRMTVNLEEVKAVGLQTVVERKTRSGDIDLTAHHVSLALTLIDLT